MNTFEEVLKFAIDSEYQAAEFYKNLLQMNQAAGMHSIFERLIKQELGHAAKLENVQKNKLVPQRAVPVSKPALNLADYLTESVEDESNLSYQDAVIIAMKREKASVKLYRDLRDTTDDPDLKAIFEYIMEEEMTHQAAFEEEYDKRIQSDN